MKPIFASLRHTTEPRWGADKAGIETNGKGIEKSGKKMLGP